MKKRLPSIINKIAPLAAILALLCVWQFVCVNGLVPQYMLPSPSSVVIAFKNDFWLLASHAKITLTEAFVGLFFGVFLGVAVAVLMDKFEIFYKAFYPLLIISQTIPTIAIAPLLVLWLGYEMLPKIVLVVITTFFPVAVGMFDGLKQADPDEITLMKVMGASEGKIFRYIKLPEAASHFFAGLKVSVTYAVVGGVISEWLGGYKGLGVYMTRVKKSYSFDKMFAVIFLISALSVALMASADILKKICMPWEKSDAEK